MKRFFKLLLISALAAITAFGFSACDGLNIRLPWNGCGSDSGDNTKTSVQPILIKDNSQTEFTMKIIEKDTFYYPTVKGKVKLNFYPSKLEVIVEDNGSFDILENDFTNLSYSGTNYIVAFEKEHIFGSLEEGDYNVTIKAYDQDKQYLINYETVFVVDDLYTGGPVINFETGETFYAMDKESHWVGPYHENELPIMPITNGGAFVTSEYDFGGSWN